MFSDISLNPGGDSPGFEEVDGTQEVLDDLQQETEIPAEGEVIEIRE